MLYFNTFSLISKPFLSNRKFFDRYRSKRHDSSVYFLHISELYGCLTVKTSTSS